jgi:hypothetical protein
LTAAAAVTCIVVCCCSYLIRQGCTSWLIFYLLEAKGAVDAAAAAITVSGVRQMCMICSKMQRWSV